MFIWTVDDIIGLAVTIILGVFVLLVWLAERSTRR